MLEVLHYSFGYFLNIAMISICYEQGEQLCVCYVNGKQYTCMGRYSLHFLYISFESCCCEIYLEDFKYQRKKSYRSTDMGVLCSFTKKTKPVCVYTQIEWRSDVRICAALHVCDICITRNYQFEPIWERAIYCDFGPSLYFSPNISLYLSHNSPLSLSLSLLSLS